jgi:hypothetical protein
MSLNVVEQIAQLKQNLLDSAVLKQADGKRERRALRNLKLRANGGLPFPKPRHAGDKLERSDARQ